MMNDNSVGSLNIWRVLGVSAITIGLNLLISKLNQSKGKKDQSFENLQNSLQESGLKLNQRGLRRRSTRRISTYEQQRWRSLKVIDHEDPLLQQIFQMTLISCEIERINNLILDLQLKEVKTFPCPIVAHKLKHNRQGPFLMADALVSPGSFIMGNCTFRAGQTIEFEKKYLRAGPRATQFFDCSEVKADIVCLGKMCPGINTIIRELTLVLKNLYKVKQVVGIKNSYAGYYNNKMIQLNENLVQTIHHHGGCFLGLSEAQFNVQKIIESLIKRKVNQVYLIGAYHTLVSSEVLYQEIKRQKLPIAICVLLKGINKDVPIFDTCFGFQSSTEQTQRFIQAGSVSAQSYLNTVSLIKVPGQDNGFLASQACRAARNVNICLVPQFPFDLFGQLGLIKFIVNRIKAHGKCRIVYAEGAYKLIRDLPLSVEAQIKADKANYSDSSNSFGLILKQYIERELNNENIKPYSVLMFNATETIRSVPANTLDTKLCCQLAHASIQGIMCGYTNFAGGHLANRNALVPVNLLISECHKSIITPNDEPWQRLLATTGQPSFLNDEQKFIEDL